MRFLRQREQRGFVFSGLGSAELHTDPDPIFDPEASTSTAGLNQATHLCDVLGVPLDVQPPRANYTHGCGEQCLNPKLLVGAWYTTIADRNGKTTSFTFDVVLGDSPIVIRLDVAQQIDRQNLTNAPHIKILRPTDNAPRKLNTYISPDHKGNPECIRIRVEFASLPRKPLENSLQMSKHERQQHRRRSQSPSTHSRTHPQDKSKIYAAAPGSSAKPSHELLTT